MPKDAKGHGSNPRGAHDPVRNAFRLASVHGADSSQVGDAVRDIAKSELARVSATGGAHPKSGDAPAHPAWNYKDNGFGNRTTRTKNENGNEYGSPAALADFKAKYGGPKSQGRFSSARREINRLKRQGK